MGNSYGKSSSAEAFLTQREEYLCGFSQTIVDSFVYSDRKDSIAPADDRRSHLGSVAA
ncbi:MAG: hypothetical protein QQW96_07490 [Tychonema bourrellyi B0820]|uniref:hypothetical protein n=1 Tax=Tychonema bourrellyi TaxID=54313 RepID=UPI0015D4F681|nr:hypothetical protein [Tychonema bourrellyi]MDQ2097473.1 hypothetical protein [Tychonema bourrellyi B0820]